jgi:hypothetical protein
VLLIAVVLFVIYRRLDNDDDADDIDVVDVFGGDDSVYKSATAEPEFQSARNDIRSSSKWLAQNKSGNDTFYSNIVNIASAPMTSSTSSHHNTEYGAISNLIPSSSPYSQTVTTSTTNSSSPYSSSTPPGVSLGNGIYDVAQSGNYAISSHIDAEKDYARIR